MGKRLAESLPAARRLYDRAAEVLGYDLAKLCFEGPADELDSTVYSQPALLRHQPGRAGIAPRAIARRGAVVRGDGRIEPGRIHGHGLCRRHGVRGRADARAAARGGHAGGRRRHPRRHGEHPRPGAGRGRGPVRARPGTAKSSKSPTCCARTTSSFPARTAACERAAEMAPKFGRDEGHAAGRGRGVPYRDHAAGRPALRRGPGRRAHASPEYPGDFQRRRPAARRSRRNPPPDGPPDPPARSAGKTRCATC